VRTFGGSDFRPADLLGEEPISVYLRLTERDMRGLKPLVSEEILDQWSYEPGFPVIRRNGGHFVRIHRTALERWLEEFALGSNPRPLRRDDPPPRSRRVRPVSNR
jgi:hypothetical protein